MCEEDTPASEPKTAIEKLHDFLGSLDNDEGLLDYKFFPNHPFPEDVSITAEELAQSVLDILQSPNKTLIDIETLDSPVLNDLKKSFPEIDWTDGGKWCFYPHVIENGVWRAVSNQLILQDEKVPDFVKGDELFQYDMKAKETLEPLLEENRKRLPESKSKEGDSSFVLSKGKLLTGSAYSSAQKAYPNVDWELLREHFSDQDSPTYSIVSGFVRDFAGTLDEGFRAYENHWGKISDFSCGIQGYVDAILSENRRNKVLSSED